MSQHDNKILRILFDFDNMKEFNERVTLEQLAVTVANNEIIKPRKYSRILIKLYGGWYQDNLPTRLMQQLQSQNKPFYFKEDGDHLIINITFANSLESRNTVSIFNTYRLSPFNKTLSHALNGGQHYCQIKNAIEIINSRDCSNLDCKQSPSTIKVYEQKIVDSMLVADLIYLSINSPDDICLVSSDDDMIPGLITAATIRDLLHLWINSRPNIRYMQILDRMTNYTGTSLRSRRNG